MLMQAQYYFMTSLPSVTTLGEPPAIGLAEFYQRACDLPGVGEAVAAVLLEHDLLLRQSVLTGETEHGEPVVLTLAQGRGEEPLPEALQVETADATRPIGDDATWEAYFRFVAAVSSQIGCGFLREWVGFEVSLRNALVETRAKALNLMADDYYVAADLAGESVDTEAIVAAWSAASDPLAAMLALDRGRWDWLSEHGQYFSFRIDEAAAYARGLVLAHRWQDLTGD